MLNQELIGHRHHSFPAPRKCSKLLLHWVRWIIMQAIILKIVEKLELYQQCLLLINNNFFHFWARRLSAETIDRSLWCKALKARLKLEHTRTQRFKSRNLTTKARTSAGEFAISLIQWSQDRTRFQSRMSEVLTEKILSSLCTSKRASQLR